MALKLVRKGTADQYNDHSRLNNLDLENQHPINVIIGLRDYLNKLDAEDIRLKAEDIRLDSEIKALGTENTRLDEEIKALGIEDIRLDEEIKELDLTLADIVEKIQNGELGGGGANATVSSLKYTSNLEYEGTKLVKETYVGDINKVVTYNYDANNNVALKTVARPSGDTVNATYEYDDQNNLVKIIDNGVDDIYISGIGGMASCITKKEVGINCPVATEIINVKNIITKEKIVSILNSEILIKNSSTTTSTLIIEQSGIEILNIEIEAGDIQKYVLGTSKSVVVKVKGIVTYEYTLNGVKDGGNSESNTPSGGTAIDKEQVTSIVNEILNPKLELINSNITDLQIQNIKAYVKYDKALNLNSNYNYNHFTDAKLDSLTKEGE